MDELAEALALRAEGALAPSAPPAAAAGAAAADAASDEPPALVEADAPGLGAAAAARAFLERHYADRDPTAAAAAAMAPSRAVAINDEDA